MTIDPEIRKLAEAFRETGIKAPTYQITIAAYPESTLLMHRDNIYWADEMKAWQSDPINKKLGSPGDDRTPAYRWVGALYLSENDEHIGIPEGNLKRCLMEAGAQIPTGKGQKTFKSQSQSGLYLSKFSPLILGGNKPLAFGPIQKFLDDKPTASFDEHVELVRKLGFDLDVATARPSKTARGRHIRVRPVFKDWMLSFSVIVLDDQITETVLNQLVTIAGLSKGLCDWRPSSSTPGHHGKFSTVSIEEMKF